MTPETTPPVERRILLNAWGRIGDPRQHKLRERYAECCTDVIVTVNGLRHVQRGKPGGYRHFRTFTDYAESFAHLYSLGVRVHLMSWLRPDPVWIRSMVTNLAGLVYGLGCERTVLLDLESAWTRGWPGKRPASRAQRLEGWQRSADLLNSCMAHEGAGLRYGVTDVPMVDYEAIEPVVACADYVMVQAHEFGTALPGSIRRPGKLVDWTYDHWPQRLREGCELVPHLAAYRIGKRPDRIQTAAGLRTSIETALGHGATSIAAWTSMSFAGAKLRRVLAEYKREFTGGAGRG